LRPQEIKVRHEPDMVSAQRDTQKRKPKFTFCNLINIYSFNYLFSVYLSSGLYPFSNIPEFLYTFF